MWDGFRYLAGNTVVLMSFVVDLIAMVFGMPRALFPQIAHESFGGPVEGGTTMALLAAAIAGAPSRAACSPAGCRESGGRGWWWSPRSCVGTGDGRLRPVQRIRRRPRRSAALAFLAVGGAADMVSAAFRSTILQQAASDDVRGRLQGVFIVVVAGGPRLADATHGAAAGGARRRRGADRRRGLCRRSSGTSPSAIRR